MGGSKLDGLWDVPTLLTLEKNPMFPYRLLGNYLN